MSTTHYYALVEILRRLHGTEPARVTPESTLTDLDVDSLTLVELSMRVERELGVVIEDRELDAEQTLRQVAELIAARRPDAVAAPPRMT